MGINVQKNFALLLLIVLYEQDHNPLYSPSDPKVLQLPQ